MYWTVYTEATAGGHAAECQDRAGELDSESAGTVVDAVSWGRVKAGR